MNGCAVAAGCNDFPDATQVLADRWENLKPSDVFRCDVLSQAHNSLTWILDLSFGAVLGGGNAHFLLDAKPLRQFLNKHIDCDSIQSNIKSGRLYAFAVSATNYSSGKSYLFIQGAKNHPIWNRVRLVTVATRISVDHVCASAAIPLVFPPVKLRLGGKSAFFGDGCIRLQQPLSPVIHLGAERIFAIGVRCEQKDRQSETVDESDPSLAQVMGVLFDAMFLDHLATDFEHLERLNQRLQDVHNGGHGPTECGIRQLRGLLIGPSIHLSHIAKSHAHDMPYLIQYFVNSLGRDEASCADLMSYLMFTSKYTRDLIEIGYQDASERIDEIEDFLCGSSDEDAQDAPVHVAPQ